MVKTWPFLAAGNFATTNARKVCKKSLNFVLNELRSLHINALKYSLLNLHKSSMPSKLH